MEQHIHLKDVDFLKIKPKTGCAEIREEGKQCNILFKNVRYIIYAY